MNRDDKLKALDAALTQIEKAYGKGSVTYCRCIVFRKFGNKVFRF